MSQDDNPQGGASEGGRANERINVVFPTPLSLGEALEYILRCGESVFAALRSYFSLALEGVITPQEIDDLFQDTLVDLLGSRDETARFISLFASEKPLAAYIVGKAKLLHSEKRRKKKREKLREIKHAHCRPKVESVAEQLSPEEAHALERILKVQPTDGFIVKFDGLVNAARNLVSREEWNALLAKTREPLVQLKSEIPAYESVEQRLQPWPNIEPDCIPGTRRTHVRRARCQLKELLPEQGFTADEEAVVRFIFFWRTKPW